MTDIIIPSSPDTRAKIKKAVKEISASMTRIEAEKDLIKSIKEVIKEDTELPPTVLGRMATDYHKQQFDKTLKEHEEYKDLYEVIMT